MNKHSQVLKLLFTIENFPPSNFGGMPIAMKTVISGLAQSNPDYEIFVLTSCFGIPSVSIPKTDSWINQDGYKINYIGSKTSYGSLKFIAEGMPLISKVDQVHLSGIFFVPNLFLAFWSILLRKKVFWSTHGGLLKPALNFKIWKKAPYLVFILIMSPFIIFRATSPQEARRIKNVLPFSKVVIIPNIIEDTGKVLVQKKKQFIFLGRIAKIKSLVNIIEACAQSNHFLKNGYIFYIAGPKDIASNGYFEEIMQRIEKNNLRDRIIYLGNITSPEKEKLLAESRALFLVSKSENFGNVVVEALQQGTPVVASNGTPWESLAEKKCGLWIDNSPTELAKALDYFIEMNELQYNQMCLNAIELSKEFKEETIIPYWTRLIKGY